MHFIFGKRIFYFISLLLLACLCPRKLFAQCPINIDFEAGDFTNWKCYRGKTTFSNKTNHITLEPTAANPQVHHVIPKGSLVDPYGQFPISAPDGSKSSVKLGDDEVFSHAESITYTFTIPADQPDFTLTYQYAVVLQDGGHDPWSQPRFTANVFDIASNTYITCSSFSYVATADLPGFKRSTYGIDVYYKPWAPVTINLAGYQGKQIRLEFTTADCTNDGHFGYAYVDIDKGCSNLIDGTDYCSNATSLTLTGPSGYDKYNWYAADRSKLLGTGNVLKLATPPADGTKILLDLIPFAGFGCSNTVIANIHRYDTELIVKDPPPVCYPSTVNLTSPTVATIADKTATLTFWKDPSGTVSLADPNKVIASGIYYVKAQNALGCESLKAIKVVINDLPTLKVTNPPTVCINTTVDITQAAVMTGSTAGLTYTFWKDAAALIPLPSPSTITQAGIYYIRGTTSSGCFSISSVKVTFFDLPILDIHSPLAVCFPNTVNLTTPAITAGSDNNLHFEYYEDANLSKSLTNPATVTQSGTYYVKATNLNGCQQVEAVQVVINALPELIITLPPEVCKPETVDITQAIITNGSRNIDKLTYWMDAGASIQLINPKAIADSGVYFIKATSFAGCDITKPILVTIHKLPVLNVTAPQKVYKPNKVDITNENIVAGSSPKLTFEYFEEEQAMVKVISPSNVTKSGTYFIKATNIYGCSIIKSTEVTVAEIPQILVPKAFTPSLTENNRLYPFLVGIAMFKSFKVYNRWGVLLFKTDNPDPLNGWDGYYKGQLQLMDTYTWYADGYDFAGNLKTQSGNTLIIK